MKNLLIVLGTVALLAGALMLWPGGNDAQDRAAPAPSVAPDRDAPPGDGQRADLQDEKAMREAFENWLSERGVQRVLPGQERGDWETTVVFSNGTEVDVTMTRPVSYYRLGKLRDFGPALDQLARAAELGDAAAALTAWQLSSRCVDIPTLDNYQAREQALRQRLEDAGVDPTYGLATFEKNFNACQSLPAYNLGGPEVWLDRAIELGSTQAMQARARELGETPEGYAYFERAWQAGDADALSSLIAANRNGWASPSGVPDHVTAYAYAYLETTVWRPVPSGGRPDTRLADFYRHLERGSFALSDADRAAGELLARDLLLANEACCIRPYAGSQ